MLSNFLSGLPCCLTLLLRFPFHACRLPCVVRPPTPCSASVILMPFQRWTHLCRVFHIQVMECFALALGLEDGHFREFYDDGFWGLRVIHYPPSNPEAGGSGKDLGCGVHTDYGCLTMINVDSTPGCLQAKNTHGEWVTVEPRPGALTCNIGDMLARWTNGLYRSTPHRVLRPGNGASRVSVPFFFEPNYQAEIAPLPECCAFTDQPPRFPPIMYGDHLFSKTASNFKLHAP